MLFAWPRAVPYSTVYYYLTVDENNSLQSGPIQFAPPHLLNRPGTISPKETPPRARSKGGQQPPSADRASRVHRASAAPGDRPTVSAAPHPIRSGLAEEN